jgi:uncharacterized protein (TIGR02145 family)/uncharacterized repeat protein (TIGR02543 family)
MKNKNAKTDKKLPILCAVSTLLIAFCGFVPNSDLDESSPNFVPPTITVDAASSIKPGDTIHFDTATLVLKGNKPQSRFEVKLDNIGWSEWGPAGAFPLSSLSNGRHVVAIKTMYEGGIKTFGDSVVFFVEIRENRPLFPPAADSIVSVDSGAAASFSVRASGSAPLTYQWYQGNFIRDGKTDTGFTIAAVTVKDTGAFFCIASNKYGSDTSRFFIIKIRTAHAGTLSLIYKGNGETAGSAPVDATTYVEGDTVVVLGNTGSLAKTGYTFAGWNTKADGSGTSYNAGAKLIMPAASVTLFAKWTNKPTASVIYKSNGSDGGTPPAEAVYEVGSIVTVSGNTGNLVKTGYAFGGWNTQADGAGTNYAAGATFIKDSTTLTLFAKWSTVLKCTVKFNSQGGSAVDSVSVNCGEKIAQQPANPTRAGYTFGGWYKEAECANAWNFPTSTVTGAMTLFAKWTAGSFTVKFNSQGGSSVDSIKANFGDKITAPPSPTRTGYTFDGWYKEAACTNLWDFSTASVAADMTLFAKWTGSTFTVTFDDQSATTPVSPKTLSVTVPATTVGTLPAAPAKTGYTFGGWFTAVNGGGTEFTATTTVSASITVYAKWTGSTYTVTFDDQSATTPVSPTTKTVIVPATTVGTLPTAPAKTGYTFGGWFTAANGGGAEFTAATTVSANLTVYAKWTINSYTVTFNCQGGSPVPPLQTVEYNAYATQPTAPTYAGYTFGGWYKESSCTNAWTFTSNKVTGTITLYAKWTVIQYTVTFNSQGGSTTPASQKVNSNGYATQPTAPSKTGYALDGWYTEAACANKWSFGTQVDKDMTLYAKWVIKDIDGNMYTEVTIGGNVWMVGNLKTTKYNDGTSIQLVTSQSVWDTLYISATPAFCWYNNNASFKDPYGALYNWDAVNTGKLAPAGWHVATKAEWEALIAELGDDAGNKVQETGSAHWNDNCCATNASGFTAVAGGQRNSGFNEMGNIALFWTSTKYVTDIAYMIWMPAGSISFNDFGTGMGLSVRCVKNK